MNNAAGVLEFSLTIGGLIILLIVVHLFLEKKRKKDTGKKFKVFSEDFKLGGKKMRTVPRIAVPDSLDVVLIFPGGDSGGLKAHAVDMSLSGFCVKPDFSLKKFPMKTLSTNIQVVTPLNTFVIKEMKTVRIERRLGKRLIAFHIEKIAEDQFDSLKKFMAYLDEFLEQR